MIKKLTIDNFKAIKHLELEFTPFTVLIGGNSCGKSTVLQALDLLRAYTYRDIDEYLFHELGWSFLDIKTQFNKHKLGFEVEFEINIFDSMQIIL